MIQLPAVNDIEAIVDARNTAFSLFEQAASLYTEATDLAERAKKIAAVASRGTSADACEDGAYTNAVLGAATGEKFLDANRKLMDSRIWTHLLERSGIRHIMDTQAVKEFRESLIEDCLPVTLETAKLTMDTMFDNANLMIKRGVVNTFAKLDRRFKSHDGFKVGSRIILDNVFDEYGHLTYGNYRRELLVDVERAVSVLSGKAPMGHAMFEQIRTERGSHFGTQQSVHEFPNFHCRAFHNGNIHVWFDNDDVLGKINGILRDYYGEVLPDGMVNENAATEKTGTAVSKDLQFYPTPFEVAEKMLDAAFVYKKDDGTPLRFLEPSAGEGAMIKALRKSFPSAVIDAIEYDETRAAKISKSGLADTVKTKNFFDVHPREEYDLVFMNPPFYGTHYMEHVYHAWQFVKPGGRLMALLPITADTGDSKKHKQFQSFVKKNTAKYERDFVDLPDGSFKESGTMISTGFINLKKA